MSWMSWMGCISGSIAREVRLIRGGGARLNDTAVTDEDFQLGAGDFIDGRAKISAGKKRHALLVIR